MMEDTFADNNFYEKLNKPSIEWLIKGGQQ